MSSPFPHPWDESSDLLLSCSKAQDLKYDQKKFRDLLFIREFAVQDRQIFRLPGVSVSSMDAKKRMIRRPSFASFEPSGQLKQFGTFQPSFPLCCNGCTHRAHGVICRFLG